MEDSLEDFIKLTRNTKQGNKKESQTSKASQQTILTAHRRKECESRAVKMVEFLIDGKLRPEVFLRCLKYINQDYYQDVVEERAISKICGYSLCDNLIPIMPAKQFFIDSKHNKVYDLTERKKYCSNFCYCASLHIKLQIDDSPLWLRKVEESSNFNILAKNERGSPGEEINQGIAKAPVKESSFTSISSFTEFSLDDLSNDEVKSRRTQHKVDKKPSLQTLDEVAELSESVTPDICEASSPKTSDELPANPSTSQIKKVQKPSKRKKDFKSIFDNIKKYVQEWMTLETYIFLYGEEEVKRHLDENHFQQYFNNLKLAESSITKHKKYLQICKKLNLNQLVEDSFDKSVLGFKIKPVPDYGELQKDNHDLEIKVRSFYSGATYEVDDVNAQYSSNNKQHQSEDSISDNPAVLPLVDINSQNALRRKIYLNSISKAMLALTKNLHMPSHHILEELSLLVKTFKLQAHNVVFEPVLWSLIALILIKMLGIRDDSLKSQLDSKQSKVYISVILNQLPDADAFFKDLLDRIENIDVFLHTYLNNDV